MSYKNLINREIKKPRKTLAAGLALLIGYQIFSPSPAFADKKKQETGANELQREFVPTEKGQIYGNLLRFNAQKGQGGDYDLDTKWPLENNPQWYGLLDRIDEMTKLDKVKNPIAQKDPNVVLLVENNSDGISGSDIYISDQGYILRVLRKPVDFFHSTPKRLYEFLDSEMQVLGGGYSAEIKKVSTSQNGIVVVFLGNSMLSNPTWVINDPDSLKIYKKFINDIISPPPGVSTDPGGLTEDDRNFDAMGSFVMYLNYPDAPAKIAILKKTGLIRFTKIKLEATCVKDEAKFFRIFEQQAIDAKDMAADSNRKRELLERDSQF